MRAPSQANMSQSFALDKKKGLPGVPGLRLLHTCCPWWRGFYRRIVNAEGGPFRPPEWACGGVRMRRRE
eukprot:5908161-Pyramimonas_sp.AAC.1